MSTKSTGEWLLSHNKYATSHLQGNQKKFKRNAYTVSITSGKGGVGKTSISLKMAKEMATNGLKVLLIDCDYNLSNTAVKLGLPINQNFLSYQNDQKSFQDCLYKDGNFHLFSACNGDLELFEKDFRLDQMIIQVLAQQERHYDYILLDCPAGLAKETLSLNAYSDYRFFVVTPDRSSVTDSYSLMKILSQKYGVKNNHLVVNRVSSRTQYSRIVKTLSETTEHFLDIRLGILGGLPQEEGEVDRFDGVLFKNAGSEFHKRFFQVLNRFTEESDGAALLAESAQEMPFVRALAAGGQDVQRTVS